MTLIVSECMPSVYQEITANEPMFLTNVRPHLYIHNSPAGSVHVELQDSTGKTIGISNSHVIASLKTEDFAHGYYKFDLESNLVDGTLYRIAVVADGGYSFSESAYLGVCHDWDNTKTNLGYDPEDSYRSPLDIEIWTRNLR